MGRTCLRAARSPKQVFLIIHTILKGCMTGSSLCCHYSASRQRVGGGRLALQSSCFRTNMLPELKVSLFFWCHFYVSAYITACFIHLFFIFFNLTLALPPDRCSISARQPYSETSCSCVLVDSYNTSHQSQKQIKVKGPEPLSALSFPFYVFKFSKM